MKIHIKIFVNLEFNYGLQTVMLLMYILIQYCLIITKLILSY